MELNLLKSTKDILKLVSEKTQKPFEFIKKPEMQTMAAVKIARKNMASHILYYKDDRGSILDHLIAHECGHICRMWDVPPDERIVPASTEDNKRLALTQLGEDLIKLAKAIPVENLGKISNMWFHGIIRQVTNIPVDMRIEKWIFDNFLELRKSQVASIDRQMRESAQVLSKRVQNFTPKKIYDSSNYINCSFAIAMESIIGKKYTAPYRRTPYTVFGSKLADLVIKSDDRGFKQDIEIIDQWTEMLSLKGWFYWADFEDLPPDYLQND